MLGVAVGALTMLGVATLDTVAETEVPVLSSLAALPTGPAELLRPPAPPATPGTCLSWSRPDAADTAVVDCAQPHLFEQAGAVALTDQVALPDDRQWRQLVNERCGPVVLQLPEREVRPGRPLPGRRAQAVPGDVGRRRPGAALRPAERVAHRRDATRRSGESRESDQSAVQEPGTCLGIDGRTVGDPVACVGQHAVETVGVVDLSSRFTGPFPQVGDQDSFLQPECSRIANAYAGGDDVIAKKKLTVYWDNLTEESWNAGSRKINCNLAALLPDRSGFAPVTGSVTGEVVVGESVAPPATAARPPDPADGAANAPGPVPVEPAREPAPGGS